MSDVLTSWKVAVDGLHGDGLQRVLSDYWTLGGGGSTRQRHVLVVM